MTDQPEPAKVRPMEVACPHCHARPLNRCQTNRGWTYPNVIHKARTAAAQAAAEEQT